MPEEICRAIEFARTATARQVLLALVSPRDQAFSPSVVSTMSGDQHQSVFRSDLFAGRAAIVTGGVSRHHITLSSQALNCIVHCKTLIRMPLQTADRPPDAAATPP
jgi:hypothetical protein